MTVRENRTGQEGGCLAEEIAALRDLLQTLMARVEPGHETGELLKIVETASRASGRLAVIIAAQQRIDAARKGSRTISEELEARMAELSRAFDEREAADDAARDVARNAGGK